MTKAKFGDPSNLNLPVIPHPALQVPRRVGPDKWLFCPNCGSGSKHKSGRQAGYQKFVCRRCSQRWSVLVAFAKSDDAMDVPLTLTTDVVDAVEVVNQDPLQALKQASLPKPRVLERDRYSPAFDLEEAGSLQFQHRLFLELEAVKTSLQIAKRSIADLLIERDHLRLLTRNLENERKRSKRESNSVEHSQSQGS